MSALTKNVHINENVSGSKLQTYFVLAAQHVYKGGFAGMVPSGHVKPFVPGDVLLGMFYQEANNADGAATDPPTYVENQLGQFNDVNGPAAGSGSASGLSSLIRTKQNIAKVQLCDGVTHMRFTLASCTVKDIGKCLYATTDNPADVALVGHPDAFIGRIVGVPLANTVNVRLKRQGELPVAGDRGSIELNFDTNAWFPNVITSVGEISVSGFRCDAIGAGVTAGTGILPLDAKAGVVKMLLDNDSEAQNLTVQTKEVFDPSKGLTLECDLHQSVLGPTATTDLDFGLMTAASSLITDAIRANMDVTTAGIGTLKIHMDGDSANILAGSDDDSSVIASTDTTIDNVTTADAYKSFKLIVRPNGTGEVWIDKVRVLASTAFSCIGSLTTLWCGIVNLEKSTGTDVSQANFRKLRVAGAGPGVAA